MRRPVTPVPAAIRTPSGGSCTAASRGELLPEAPDREPAEFTASGRRDCRRPDVDRAHLWTRDVRVAPGPVALARAAVTLREGRLVSEREALEEPPGPGAPAGIVEDTRRRRYGGPAPSPEGRRVRRAEPVRGRLGPAIDGPAAAYA